MSRQKKSWIEKKLSKSSFKEGFETELERLAIAEQIVRMRKASGQTQAQLAKKIKLAPFSMTSYGSTRCCESVNRSDDP